VVITAARSSYRLAASAGQLTCLGQCSGM